MMLEVHRTKQNTLKINSKISLYSILLYTLPDIIIKTLLANPPMSIRVGKGRHNETRWGISYSLSCCMVSYRSIPTTTHLV